MVERAHISRWRLSPKDWAKGIEVWKKLLEEEQGYMTLREWMLSEGLFQPDLARELNTSQPLISRWMRDAIVPSIDMLLKIEDMTGGKVVLRSFTVEAKEAGDRRLVKAGLLPPEALHSWEKYHERKAKSA